MTRILKSFLLSSALFLLVAFILAAKTEIRDTRVHGPIIKNKNGTSTNWSGYAVYNSGASTDVKGSWVVPGLTCPSGQTTYSSAWVGIDGYNTNTVEQTGTEHDCSNGTSSYYAWYEMYPKPGFKVPLTISQGDVITAEVKFQGRGSFTLTLTDTTTGKSYTTNQKSTKAQLGSAEWIMEAPWSGGVLPLADFGTDNYSAGTANVGGHSGTIGSFPTIDRIDMVQSDGVTLKDQTSALNSSGNSFSVTWKNN